ncbi:uncharacterized protein MONBRDRAFT_11879 [Monosiga brevicollis MX1]|uniref:Uncharacterized protein n=1 Tax=Monosiga brevicollis TaxID=81824 RepID=A9VAK1_MONBE|nr:uncharacterized protein MONBRDRAFT_11879 [Monosiga brevicollis MX1]EDQ85388.1 predicted protein [Monosiga brevicollis MX1]|eukprot:XP_001749799.1 hypothetical protein [Monosiga brevicollis MX1]
MAVTYVYPENGIVLTCCISRGWFTMSSDGERLYRACCKPDGQPVAYLFEHWEEDRLRSATQYRNPRTGDTPLHEACYHHNLSDIETLMLLGADIKIENWYALEKPLQLACERGHVQVVKKVLGYAAAFDAQGKVRIHVLQSHTHSRETIVVIDT